MFDLQIRLTELEDAYYLEQWLDDDSAAISVLGFPGISRDGCFERHDATLQWTAYVRYQSSLTAEVNGIPVGVATLFLMGPKTMSHQSEIGIILDANFRGKGIGSKLLEALIDLGRNTFSLEILFLYIGTGNPAKSLYEKFGFQEICEQKHWFKFSSGLYQGRILMEKRLIQD